MTASPLALLLVALISASTAGCEKSGCEKTCSRVAQCKLAAQVGGERELGERPMPPDPGCMDRCAKQTKTYGACEDKRRECATLLDCLDGQ